MHRVGDGLVYISEEEIKQLLRKTRTPPWIPIVSALVGAAIPWIVLWLTGDLG